MENTFGAEYLETVDARTYGGFDAISAYCRVITRANQTYCLWLAAAYEQAIV